MERTCACGKKYEVSDKVRHPSKLCPSCRELKAQETKRINNERTRADFAEIEYDNTPYERKPRRQIMTDAEQRRVESASMKLSAAVCEMAENDPRILAYKLRGAVVPVLDTRHAPAGEVTPLDRIESTPRSGLAPRFW